MRLAHVVGQRRERVLVRRPQLLPGQAQHRGDPLGQRPGVLVGGAAPVEGLDPGLGEQRGVLPQRHPVGAPLEADVPPGQRLARVPLALAPVHDPSTGVHLAEAVGEVAGQGTLLGAVGVGVPLRRGGVVEGDEGGLAAHRQAHVALPQALVDGLAEGIDAGPLGVGVGLGDPGVLVDAGDLVVEGEGDLDRVGGALDGRGAAGVRGRRQRDVPLAGEERGGGVHADPARTGDEHLGPGVQVGEVLGRAAGAVEALLVGGELDEVAGDEAGGQAVHPQQADQQPRGVAARPDAQVQRLVGVLHARLHAHAVGDVAVDRGVELGEERDRGDAVLGQVGQPLPPGGQVVAGVDGAQVRREVGRQRVLVGEREPLGVLLDEEVERVDRHQVRDQSDGDVEGLHLLGEDQAGQPVAEGVLLPVHEVVGRLHVQAVGLDRRAAVRRRPQPHHVRCHRHRLGEVVGGAVLQRDLDRHGASIPRARCVGVTPCGGWRPYGGIDLSGAGAP